MKEHADEQEIAVGAAVDRAEGGGGPHHLRDVFDESSTARVVVFPGGGGAFKTIPKFLEKHFPKPPQPGVGHLRDKLVNVRGIPGMFLPQIRWSVQQRFLLQRIERAQRPVAGLQSEAPHGPLTRHRNVTMRWQGLGQGKMRGIPPDPQHQMIASVGQFHLQKGAAGFRGLDLGTLHLGVDFTAPVPGSAESAEFGDGGDLGSGVGGFHGG